MIHTVYAQREFLEQIAIMLREPDRRELMLGTGKDSFEALLDLKARVPDMQVGFIEREGITEPLGVFGLQIHDETTGASPFMLGCIAIQSCRGSFHRLAKEYVEGWREMTDFMWNFVDAENQGAIDWLEVLGFVVSDEVTPYGMSNAPFHYFEWRAH